MQTSWDRGRNGQWVVKNAFDYAMEGSPFTKLQQQAQILKPLCACCRFFSMGWVRGCVRIRALYFIHMYICRDG